MKNLLIGTILILCLFACQSHDPDYVIEGSLPTSRYDGEWIYLAPVENATLLNIDSVKIQDGRFTFRGRGEEMKVLRMRILLRLDFQELLVVTEPGIITARIDSISSAHGTPQNEALQRWKEEKERTDPLAYDLWKQAQEASAEDSIRITHSLDSLRKQIQTNNYVFLKDQIHHTLGKFLYRMIKPSLNETQQKELDEAGGQI